MVARVLPLDELAAGMVLATGVCDAGGSLLLPKGATLTEVAIKGLRRREIGEVCIEFVALAEPPDGAALALMRQGAGERVHHLFRHAGKDAVGQAFFQTVLDYRLESLS